MCPIARSLDVLGERWTIVVIRELLLGPKRFKHLLAALPAIGSNRLSDRLRGLDEAGIVRKAVLPPPVTVPVYELTVAGERLREPLLRLGSAFWSTRNRVEAVKHAATYLQQRRRAELNRCTGFCRPLPEPLGHAAGTEGYLTRGGPAPRRVGRGRGGPGTWRR